MAKRLPASSLVEVTVAAAILVLVFGLALAVCARLMRHGPTPRQLHAEQLAHDLAARTVRSGKWRNLTEEVGPIMLEQTVSLYHRQPHLYQIHVQALVQDSVLASYHELVFAPPANSP